MSIKVQVETDNKQPAPTFPALRLWSKDIDWQRDEEMGEIYGPLVVLFVSPSQGIALSGKHPNMIGVLQEWIEVDDYDMWVKCSITLTSEN